MEFIVITQFRIKKNLLSLSAFPVMFALTLSITMDESNMSLQASNLNKCLTENTELPISHVQHPCNKINTTKVTSWSNLFSSENTSLHFHFQSLIELLHYHFQQDV
jgi:trehalose-6-phosphate synthase